MARNPRLSHQRLAMTDELRARILAYHFRGRAPDPEAGSDPRMVAFLTYLYAPDTIHKASGLPVLCAGTLAALEGRSAQFAAKNYVARDLMLEYRARVDPTFGWLRYTMEESCRRAARFDSDPDLVALARSPLPAALDDLVYAADGSPVTQESKAGDLQRLREAAERSAVGAVDRRVEAVLSYLNGLPSNRFTSAVNRFHADACSRARELFEAGGLTTAQFEAAVATMNALVVQPTPVYQLSQRGRSQRLFPASPGMLTLKSDVSEAYRAGWTTYDLSSVQTAINAVDWGADRVVRFLEDHLDEPGAVWRHLAAAVGDRPLAEVKGALKIALYSIQYGKGVDRVSAELDQSLGAGAGGAFVSDVLVGDLVGARERAYAGAERSGEIEGAFGERIPIEPGRDAASVFADRAQGVEFLLLYPAVERALATDRWDICLWQHDGFDVAVRDASRWTYADREIRAAVDSECRRRGYPTRLVAARSPAALRRTGDDRSPTSTDDPRPPQFDRGRRV